MAARAGRFSRPLGFVCGATLAALAASAAAPERAAAFCGFYVAGADAKLYANATMVVLMRDGTRTVLSMQNNYQGPPEAFALVIPVPTVLQQDQVKVLPRNVFERVDALGAPRLVEYWETDPCQVALDDDCAGCSRKSASAGGLDAGSAETVRVEAQFVVGEYDVVVLSADDSSALDKWLRGNSYNIPQGAEPVLAPYVAAGMKFFVAKVDPSRVNFEHGQAALSPLRFHYDTPEFSLPVRLGLLNSQGSQDLIVNILARERYELANYANVTIPTNLRVQDAVRNEFGAFYEALFTRTLERNPGAVVTEYAWSAASCDPCPTEPLDGAELATLGADVLQTRAERDAGISGFPGFDGYPSFTLTRLHARYTKDSLGEDLVFKQAEGIVGGRGIPDEKGQLDQKVEPQRGDDSFQGRYVILHPWEGRLACARPQRGSWGGENPTGASQKTKSASNAALRGAPPSAGDLPSLLAESVPALDVLAKHPKQPLARSEDGGCAIARGPAAGSRAAFWLLLAASLLGRRRRVARQAP